MEGRYIVTLPADHAGSPIRLLGHVNSMTVWADGKVIADLRPRETARFEVELPRPWQFWRKPRWRCVEHSF